MDKKTEIISFVQRRRRWSQEEKLAILTEAFESGSSVAAVADRNGVSRSLLYNWLRRVGEGRMPGVSLNGAAERAFVPVQIGERASVDSEPPTSRTNGPVGTQTRIVEIALGNGRILRVAETIASATLARIAAALDGPAKS